MALTHKNSEYHIYAWAGWAFILSCVAFIASFFFAMDTTSEIPSISEGMLRMGQLGTAFVILGATVLAVKYAEEKDTMASIAFTLYSIAQGVVFVVYIISYNSKENLEEGYQTFSASLFLLAPAMVLIALYSEFPKWLRWLAILSFIPYIIENISFEIDHTFNSQIMILDGIGNSLTNIMILAWGIILIQRSRRLKKSSAAATA